jgi:iron(III) transport system substrate-binding protein
MKVKVVVAFLICFQAVCSIASAQDAKLVDAAKKEGGRVVVYGSLENETVELIAAALKKKTGLEIDFWRAASTKVMDRVINEMRAGKPLYDVVQTPTPPMEFMFKAGALSKYDSPAAKGFPKEVIHPDLGPQYRNGVIGIVYHAGIIKPADAPKTLQDLLKPQYRGKFVMPDPSQHTTTAQWFASLHKVMGGQEPAEKFIRDLAATKPLLVESLTPAGERISTGERPIGLAFVKNVVFYGQKGIPMDYVRLGKFMGDGQAVALAAKPPHPNAGRAFIDFFIGEESLKIMADLGEFVTRKGVPSPIPGADKIELVEMVDMDKKAYAEKMAEYRKIFLQR